MMAKSLILLEVSEKWDLLVGFIKKNAGRKRGSVGVAESRLCLGTVHNFEKLVVGFGHGQFVDKEFHGFHFTHRIKNFAEDPHFL